MNANLNANACPFLSDADQSLVERILAPLPFGSPCGVPLRFDPVFTEIRLLREEDDPGLPMGQWERPLKLADWPAVEAHCVEQLCTRSKHLQLAAWLVEAWTRQRGLSGLCQGLTMLEALLRRHWEQLHPMIDEDGDCELRLAPLEWLGEALGDAVHLHVPLVELPGMKPPSISLAEWERIAVQDAAGEQPDARRDESALLNREEVYEHARQAIVSLRSACVLVGESLRLLAAIDQVLAETAGDAAPKLARLASRLAAAERVLTQLLADSRHEVPASLPAEEPASETEAARGVASTLGGESEMRQTQAPVGWRNRAEAYSTLNALAEYLAEIEPHSPVPFLIRRAVHWGGMPLPELISEIISQEGDLHRLVSFLRITP